MRSGGAGWGSPLTRGEPQPCCWSDQDEELDEELDELLDEELDSEPIL